MDIKPDPIEDINDAYWKIWHAEVFLLANKLFWKIFTTIEFTKDLNDDVVAGNIYYRFQSFNLFDVIITITKHLFNKK